MALRRTKEAALVLAGAVLIASVFGASSAPATPLGQAADTVGSVVPTVTGTPSPPLPNAAPPQTPVPAAPQAPAQTSPLPQAPSVELPTVEGPGTTPNSSHLVPAPSSGSTKDSSTGVDLPSVHEVTSGTREPAGTATSTSTEGVQQTAASARNGVGKGSGSHGATTRPGIESAKAAPLGRLLAYVWPAIALGPAGKLLAMLQARWEAATSFPVANVARLLSGLTGAAGSGRAAGFSEHSAIPNPSPADSPGIWEPGGGEISLLVFIVLCAALMALLVFTVRRELRSIYRWPL
jgi:hypothetical protein